MLKRIFKNEFVRGSFFVTSAALIGGVINYVCNIINARYLGPAGYGEFAALFSYMSVTSIPISIIMTFILQVIGSDRKKSVQYAYITERIFWLKAKRWWFLGIPFIVSIPFLSSLLNVSLITSIVLFPLVFFIFISSLYATCNQGMRLFFMISVVALCAVIIKLFGSLGIMIGIDGYVTIVIFFVLSYFVSISGYYLLFKKKTRVIKNIQLKNPEQRILQVITNPYFFMITASIVGTVLLGSIDIIFVKKYFSGIDTGIYSLWIVCAKILYFLLGPIIGITFIFFSNKSNAKEKNLVFIISIILILIGGIVNYVLYRWYGGWFIHTFFGSKYTLVIPFMEKASLFAFFYSLFMFLNGYILAQKRKLIYILPIGIVLYIGALFITGRSLQQIMDINIVFSCMMCVGYGIGLMVELWKNKQLLTMQKSG